LPLVTTVFERGSGNGYQRLAGTKNAGPKRGSERLLWLSLRVPEPARNSDGLIHDEHTATTDDELTTRENANGLLVAEALDDFADAFWIHAGSAGAPVLPCRDHPWFWSRKHQMADFTR
jgi:hypothetical protein